MDVDTSQRNDVQHFEIKAQVDAQARNADELLARIQNAIDEIYKGNHRSLEYSSLYMDVYYLVMSNNEQNQNANRLHSLTVDAMTSYLENLCKSLDCKDGEEFLAASARVWVFHRSAADMISGILCFMDTNYLNDVRLRKPRMAILGSVLWKGVFFSENRRQKLCACIIEQINRERKGKAINRKIVRDSIRIFEAERVYENYFQKAFLLESAEFYRKEIEELIQKGTGFSEYLTKGEERVKEEVKRTTAIKRSPEQYENYLLAYTEPLIVKIVLKEYIEERIGFIVDVYLQEMVNQDKFDDLSRLLKLCQANKQYSQELIKFICKGIQTHVSSALKEAVANAGDEAMAYIQVLLDFLLKYKGIIRRTHTDYGRLFHTIVQDVTSNVMNANKHSPKYLALYIDSKLRLLYSLNATTEAIEQVVSNAADLVVYINDKDAFANKHTSYLAHRLLCTDGHVVPVALEAEKNLVDRIRDLSDFNLTKSMEVMISDIAFSRNQTIGYQVRNNFPKPDLSVNLLTSAAWPLEVQKPGSKLPPHVFDVIAMFMDYFNPSNRGRKVEFQTDKGRAELKLTFKNKQYILNVSTMQMCILLLLGSEKTHWTYAEIKEETQIAVGVKRCLFSLYWDAEGNNRNILLKTPHTRRIKDDDVFIFNPEFESDSTTVTLPGDSRPETTAERLMRRKKIVEDRKGALMAAVVRFMKGVYEEEGAVETDRTRDVGCIVNQAIQMVKRFFKPSYENVVDVIEELVVGKYLARQDSGFIYVPTSPSPPLAIATPRVA
eukprot:Gb_39651 [translate_table: standard]